MGDLGGTGIAKAIRTFQASMLGMLKARAAALLADDNTFKDGWLPREDGHVLHQILTEAHPWQHFRQAQRPLVWRAHKRPDSLASFINSTNFITFSASSVSSGLAFFSS